MIFWTVIGIVIGFFFKPQIEDGLHRVAGYIQDKRSKK